jgi:hypothetical protein
VDIWCNKAIDFVISSRRPFRRHFNWAIIGHSGSISIHTQANRVETVAVSSTASYSVLLLYPRRWPPYRFTIGSQTF